MLLEILPGLLMSILVLYLTGLILGWIWPGTPESAIRIFVAGYGAFVVFAVLTLLVDPNFTLTFSAGLVGFLLPAVGLHVALTFPGPVSFRRVHLLGYAAAVAADVAFSLLVITTRNEKAIALWQERINVIYVVLLGLVSLVLQIRIAIEQARARPPEEIRPARLFWISVSATALPSTVSLVTLMVLGLPSPMELFVSRVLFALALVIVAARGLRDAPRQSRSMGFYLILTVSGVVIQLVLTLGFAVIANSPLLRLPLCICGAIALVVIGQRRFRWQRLAYYSLGSLQRNGSQVLDHAGSRLLTCLRRDEIAAVLRAAVESTIPDSYLTIYLGPGQDGALVELGGTRRIAKELTSRLAAGRTVTTSDGPRLYTSPDQQTAIGESLRKVNASIVVPIGASDALRGALTLGPRSSASAYVREDMAFLRGLGTEAALALRNAESFEALERLNASLEIRVHERTAQLEAANHELEETSGALEISNLQLRDANSRLGSANAALDSQAREIELYARAVSHDVRSPITAAAESLRLLGDGDPVASNQWYARAVQNVRRADLLLGKLRDLMVNGVIVTQPTVVPIGQIVEEAIAVARQRQHGDVVEIAVTAALPDVWGHPRKIEIVFENLLGNAVKYAAQATDRRIEIGAECARDEATFWIKDYGEGVPAEFHRRIFEPFERGPNSKGEGLGLGLTLVRQIISQHDGEIWFESAPGDGTTFFFTLPLSSQAFAPRRCADTLSEAS